MLNVTVPVGVPAPGATAATVAVKVTAWPDADGLADEVTVVVLFALVGVSVRVVEVLVLKLSSPLYVAVTVWVPTARVDAVSVACPLARFTLGVWAVPSMLNVTVPVGVG